MDDHNYDRSSTKTDIQTHSVRPAQKSPMFIIGVALVFLAISALVFFLFVSQYAIAQPTPDVALTSTLYFVFPQISG